MAKPTFIYAFDNLGPERFTEVCGLLLASRYRGFLLGGVGPDGGVDSELDEVLGIWKPESISPLLNEIIQPERTVIFQFKHKVTARVGQAQSRTQLLTLYKCQQSKSCELHRNLVLEKHPNVYVLVTNVETNSEFRAKFIAQCRLENPQIEHYQIIGLDELENWVATEIELRHLYFPTIFGPPRFNLQIQFNTAVMGHPLEVNETINVFTVDILNVGLVPSYIRSVVFKIILDGQIMIFYPPFNNPIANKINPPFGIALEPGRKQTYIYTFDMLRAMKGKGNEVFPLEILVFDEIGNEYRAAIADDQRRIILE